MLAPSPKPGFGIADVDVTGTTGAFLGRGWWLRLFRAWFRVPIAISSRSTSPSPRPPAPGWLSRTPPGPTRAGLAPGSVSRISGRRRRAHPPQGGIRTDTSGAAGIRWGELLLPSVDGRNAFYWGFPGLQKLIVDGLSLGSASRIRFASCSIPRRPFRSPWHRAVPVTTSKGPRPQPG